MTASRYILHSVLSPEVIQHHRNVVNEIAEKTGLLMTQRQGLNAHFTLKYPFQTNDLEPLANAVQSFCATRVAAPIEIAGLGHFGDQVLFANVHLSDHAKDIFDGLIQILRGFEWMQWNQYDAENLHFHATLAERCGENFDEADRIARNSLRSFSGYFNNVTILRETQVRNGIDYWEIEEILYIPEPRS